MGKHVADWRALTRQIQPGDRIEYVNLVNAWRRAYVGFSARGDRFFRQVLKFRPATVADAIELAAISKTRLRRDRSGLIWLGSQLGRVSQAIRSSGLSNANKAGSKMSLLPLDLASGARSSHDCAQW